jgi:hypothetical protein
MDVPPRITTYVCLSKAKILIPTSDLFTPEVPSSDRFIPSLHRNKSHKSAEFINKWILHQLRVSPMGIWHLQHLPIWGPLRRKGWDDYDISRYVLDRWYFDDAALAPLSTSSYYGEGVSVNALPLNARTA